MVGQGDVIKNQFVVLGSEKKKKTKDAVFIKKKRKKVNYSRTLINLMYNIAIVDTVN